jgi:hypothetical protein
MSCSQIPVRQWCLSLIVLSIGLCSLLGAPAPVNDLEQLFSNKIHPFLEQYCFECHSQKKHKGNLDLTRYSNTQFVIDDYRRWDVILEKLVANEMPPEDADEHPAVELRQQIIDWFQKLRNQEIERNSGDPGVVLAHRLSNSEYDYAIRDLTGVDIRPAHEFPVDPANEAGFDNSGESLSMSPALTKKYLEAARRVSEHIAFKPDGFSFAPHPMITEPDRDKYCVNRIIEFYRRQPTNYTTYFFAAWQYTHRAALGEPAITVAEIADRARVSPKYLSTIVSALTEEQSRLGPSLFFWPSGMNFRPRIRTTWLL